MEQQNISYIIFETINNLLNNLFSSIDTTLYEILDELAFIDTNILKISFFEKIFGTSSTNGLLLIANSLLIAFVIYYAVKLAYSNYTSQPVESPHHFVFRLLILGISINSSFFICEQILNINHLLSSSIQELGQSIFGFSISFSKLIEKLNVDIYSITSDFNIFSFDGISKTFITISLFNLIFSYSLRYIMIKLFCLLTPFALLTLLNNSTSWFFKSWIRCIFSLLIMQSFIALILLLVFSISFNSNTMSKLTYLGCIYALVHINSYIRQLIGGISTDVSNNFGISPNLFNRRS